MGTTVQTERCLTNCQERVQIALLKYSVLVAVDMHQTKVHIFCSYANGRIIVTQKVCHIVSNTSVS